MCPKWKAPGDKQTVPMALSQVGNFGTGSWALGVGLPECLTIHSPAGDPSTTEHFS